MTDRELLEWAAKAAGVRLTFFDDVPRNTTGADPAMNIYAFPIWNPLTDDGYALRLAVKLDIEFYRANDDGWASYAGYWGKPERRDVSRIFAIEYDDDLNNKGDPCASTRRAIVRAAAEIGKSMP